MDEKKRKTCQNKRGYVVVRRMAEEMRAMMAREPMAGIQMIQMFSKNPHAYRAYVHAVPVKRMTILSVCICKCSVYSASIGKFRGSTQKFRGSTQKFSASASSFRATTLTGIYHRRVVPI